MIHKVQVLLNTHFYLIGQVHYRRGLENLKNFEEFLILFKHLHIIRNLKYQKYYY